MFCNIRTASAAQLGGTVHRSKDSVEPLCSFPASNPMVYAGLYPIDQSKFNDLRLALEKLLINDSAVTMETESRYISRKAASCTRKFFMVGEQDFFMMMYTLNFFYLSSAALGSGFRLGFLGLLHMDVFSQRLAQEFGSETIATAPSVCYKSKNPKTPYF